MKRTKRKIETPIKPVVWPKLTAHRDGWDDAGQKFYENGRIVLEQAETNHREKAANLYQALCRIRHLADAINAQECPVYSSCREYADSVDSLSYAIREIADKITSENEA